MSELAEIRRKNLELIVDRLGLAAAARRFNKPASQIRDMITKRKSFGEKVARNMEEVWEKEGFPRLSFDAERIELEELIKQTRPHTDGSLAEGIDDIPHHGRRAASPESDFPPQDFVYNSRPSKTTSSVDEVFSRLPEDLRRNTNKPIKVGQLSTKVDYMSDKLVVELKRVGSGASIDSGILQLVTLKAILDTDSMLRYVLVLLQGSLPGSGVQQAMIRGGLLGIDVYVTTSADEAAHLIEHMEKASSQTPQSA